jgi:ATP-dependent RNA helicase DeaD
MDKDILELTKNYQNNPVIVNVVNERVNTPKIQQLYFEVMSKNKPELLTRLLDLHNIKLCLVFCNTKSQVDELVEFLKTRGYFAEGLHGDMSQSHRDKVMKGFRKGSIEILVATDVAGRGIDVNDVEAVFNYDLPRDDEDYVHRIGRTGRAGKTGRAFTFVSGKQVYNLKRIEKSNGIQIQRQNVPSVDDLQSTRIDAYASQIKDTIEAGHISKYVNQVELIMGEDFTSIDIAAALLKIVLEKEIENFDDSIDFEEIERKDFKNKEKRRDRDKYNKSNDGRRDRRERPKRDFKDKPKQNNSEKRWYERTFDAKTEDNETKTFSDRPKKKFEGKFEKDYSKDKKFRSKRETNLSLNLHFLMKDPKSVSKNLTETKNREEELFQTDRRKKLKASLKKITQKIEKTDQKRRQI